MFFSFLILTNRFVCFMQQSRFSRVQKNFFSFFSHVSSHNLRNKILGERRQFSFMTPGRKTSVISCTITPKNNHSHSFRFPSEISSSIFYNTHTTANVNAEERKKIAQRRLYAAITEKC